MTSKLQRKTAGFTLVELMISMSVTLVLLYAAVAMFRDASSSNQVVTQGSDMTDNLRAGLNLIQQDLQQAGTGIPTGGVPIPFTSNGNLAAPCGTTAEPNRPTLTGSAQFRACNSTLPAVEPGFALGPIVQAPDSATSNATDEITVLYADSSFGLDNKPINQPANPGPPAQPACNGTLTISGLSLLVTFDTSVNCAPVTQPGIKLNPGDLILFSNSLGSAIMAVTSASASAATFAPGDAFNLNGRKTDNSGTIWQLMPSGCNGAPACFPPTTAQRIWMISYYLDNISSPPYVRLIRRVNFNAPTPVGETLENLQFTYNFVDGVHNPSNLAVIPVGNSETQIRTVNVLLAARSSYTVKSGSKPTYARNNLVTQISLRSMAYTNKYQ
jgi:prepilin-type N-terminal cleavage/methylation domain-containing protein